MVMVVLVYRLLVVKLLVADRRPTIVIVAHYAATSATEVQIQRTLTTYRRVDMRIKHSYLLSRGEVLGLVVESHHSRELQVLQNNRILFIP